MSDLRVSPGRLAGTLFAPPSKSAAHRALICAALSGGAGMVSPVSASADMEATLSVLSAMGAQFQQSGSIVRFSGGRWSERPVTLDCGESGSTLRFLLPVAAALSIPAVFVGRGRLPQRPIGVLTEELQKHGVSFSAEKMPFSISGRLHGGRFFQPGDVSSQFISGLLFALPLAEEDSEIVLTSPLQSAGYVDMTLAALRQSGIVIEKSEYGWRIPGRQRYRAGAAKVEGDWSNAAFWLCAGALGGDVTVDGLDSASAQGDRAILKLLEDFGAAPAAVSSTARTKAAHLCGCSIDAGPIPDLVPIVAVTAAMARGDTEIYNAARLRMKESDRLSAVTALLRGLGGRVDEYPDRLVIHGGHLRGGEADGAGDHRIVMAAAIAALGCEEPVTIRGAQAVEKSYPDFFDDFQKLGGCCHVI